ncbi:MAG: helix-hairpin-helix domain-containing protein [Coleofasciculaceae cyanobacterium]
MKSIFRFLAIACAGFFLVFLTNCAQTQTTGDASKSSPAADSTPTATTTTDASGKNKININSAILSELDKFESKLGVPALSNKIQASRPYSKPEELVSKKVITQEQFDQIKDQVTIEDVVLTGEAKDVDYMVKLGLMKGHMLVAKELLNLKKPEQAEPHIGHPVEEIYADVADQLEERKVPEFKKQLINLQDLLKSKPNDPQLITQFEASMKSIDQAIAALPETQRQSPNFALQVINGLLDTANSEYGAAIANGKISAAIEYQDSRGFVIYADTLKNAIAEQLTKQNAEAQKEINATMTELKTAWPSPIPPAAPILPTDKVTELIKSIEKDAQKVT